MTHKMFMLIPYITCFAIYLGTQQCIHFYFRGNISSFMTENNSSRFFLDAWYMYVTVLAYELCGTAYYFRR